MNFSPSCAIILFLAVCSSGASGADSCTDGLLPQQQETLLLQHQVSVDAEQGTDFLESALQFIFGSDPDTKNDSAPSGNKSSSRNTTDAGDSAGNGAASSKESVASSNSTSADGNSSAQGSAAGNESDEASKGSNGSTSENATGAASIGSASETKTDADGNASETGSAADNKTDVNGKGSNGSSSENATSAGENASVNRSAADSKTDVIGKGSNGSSSENATGANGNASVNRSAAGNKTDVVGKGSNGSSSENATGAGVNGSAADNESDGIGNDSNESSSENRSNNSNISKNGSVAFDAPLPRKEQLMFDALAAKLNTSREALASADELVSNYKKQTALEIHYGETAALAEAAKLDALHEMDRMLNESMSLERVVMNNIPARMKERVLPDAASRAANRSFEASDAAAQAAKLAQVVHIAEVNYSAAIAEAFEARRKRDLLSSTILKFLNSSIANELNLTRVVEAINSSYYLNLSGNTEIKAKGNVSNQNLTEIVKADIERFSPPDTTTSTTTTTKFSTRAPDDVPDDVPDSSVPSITVTIVDGSDDGSDAKQEAEKKHKK